MLKFAPAVADHWGDAPDIPAATDRIAVPDGADRDRGAGGRYFGDTDGRIVSNVAALATYSFCAFFGAVLAEKKPDHLLAKSTVVAAGIGFLLATVLIWAGWKGEN